MAKKTVVRGPVFKGLNSQQVSRLANGKINFPTIKYIYVAKTSEGSSIYNVDGIPRQKKVYGIGILTDKNRYYFSELHLRHKEVTHSVETTLSSIFLCRYRMTQDVRICISDNIKRTKDPVHIFLDIIGSAFGIDIKHSNRAKMLLSINSRLHYIQKKGKNKLTKWNANRIFKKLVQNNKFEFITDPQWLENLETVKRNIKQAYIECAIGILYQFCRDKDYRYREAVKKHKIEKYRMLMKETPQTNYV